jgi:flagellin
MLTRLKSLATQSANGTYEDGVDRANIQEETDALLSEIDRISESTNFNGIKLLDGSLSGESEVANVAITETVATTGKFTIGNSAAGVNSTNVGSGLDASITFVGTTASATATDTSIAALTADEIGKSVSYTVTWKDADGNEKTTTATLTFQGQGDGTVADFSDSTKAVKNYFTDVQGTKYELNASAQLEPTDIRKAIKAGLENDKEFSSNFKVVNGDDDANVGAGKFLFETKSTGSHTAQIVGASADANFIEADTNAKIKKAVAGTSTGTAQLTQEAQDAYQRFNIGEMSVVEKGASKEEIEAATFEIDGNKFLLVAGDDSSAKAWTDADTKALDSDITIVKATSMTGKGKIDLGTTSTDFGDTDEQMKTGKELAAAIQQKTGRTVEFHGKADVTDSTVQGDPNNVKLGSDINKGDLIFKDADNKLNLDGNELQLQVGDTPEKYQQVSVKIQDMSSKGLGLTGLDLSNQEGAAKAIDTIQNAVNAVSTQRGQLGALQNRLDHTLNNLDATEQNITAAESQIRDVDMAKEMTQYSKNNILVQAAQSMLAQANSLPQGVLSLLQ